jgi:Transglycosylase SLT domain
MLARASVLSTRAYGSIQQSCWRAHAAIIDLLCMAIRSAAVFVLRMQASYARLVADTTYHRWGLLPLIMVGTIVAAFGLGWYGAGSVLPHDDKRDDSTGVMTIDAVVEKIISVESNGDPNAKNKRSSAMGLAQFLDETWLDLMRAHRPDLARGRNKDKILELRRDAEITREITMRFTEQNAGMLRKRGLPVTPGTLYLAHFAGGAGAVAILSALGDADAASVMASADATGRTKRDKIIRANPFLERFTVADLRSWADRKMRVPGSY